ncbi:sugar-binding domain-containing protein [Propionibacterium sp.]|uniref:sugar-binding domain-containing protein n=1 Tax=Propionibacterium sp. TaxID=1977903 RepID=UPI0039E7F3E4
MTSVGTPDGDLPGHLYDSGYLDQDDLTQLRAQHVVGNLGAVFFRQDGSTDGIPLNARTTGLPFDQIRRIHTRMLVAADPAKAPAVRAALASGLVTHVVLDSSTAQAVLAE